MTSLTLRILLCLVMAIGVNASPVTYQQVDQKAQNPTNKSATPQSSAQGTLPADNPVPDFVRLSDGRIVPFGPGLICTDDCIQTEAVSTDGLKAISLPLAKGLSPWLLAPVAATGIVACALLCGGGSSQTTSPVLDTSNPPIINPPPTPGADVPEPSTLILLSLGLAGIARSKFRNRKVCS